MGNLKTPETVQRLRTALHTKAKEEPGYRFYLLYDKIYRRDILEYAYRSCKANKGAAGVDGVDFEAIEAYGEDRWLGELAERLRKKDYQPEAVKRVWIPKPNGKLRPLGIPTITDRVVETAAMIVLEPIFEADLQPEQYAYQAGRGAQDAVKAVHRLLNTGHHHVIDADLSGYFDSIPHAELMKSVSRRIVDGNVLLGGHIDQCDSCGTIRHHFHSCRNRQCPKCQTRAKEQWIAARNRELLPVPYAHVVFTIPHVLNDLAGRHFRLITDILFACASRTLIEFGANPRWLGGELAFSLVLHTWTQDLRRHLHVHALVANGALAGDGRWIEGKPNFLFPAKALSKVFREKFMDALKLARQDQRLGQDADDDAAWRGLLVALRRHDWVVYAKPAINGPAQVLDYLGRYTHKTAISNERLIDMRDGDVLSAPSWRNVARPSVCRSQNHA